MDPLAMLASILSLPLVARLVAATTVQVINIDDADVSYSPPDKWSQGADCKVCTIRPDPSEAHDGTWHDTTSHSDQSPHSFELQFTGTGISVFNIICNKQVRGQTTTTSLDFFLDDEESPSQTFSHSPDKTASDFQFQFPVYATTGLDNVAHTLRVQAASGVDSFVLFDFAQFTQVIAGPQADIPTLSAPSTTSSSTLSTSSLSSTTATSTLLSQSSTTSSKTPLPLSFSTSFASPSPSQTILPTDAPGTSELSVSTYLPTPSNTSAPSTNKIPIGLVAGATAGGVGGLVLLLISIVLLRNRSRHASASRLRTERSEHSKESFRDNPINRHIPSAPSFSGSDSVLLIGDAARASQVSRDTGQSRSDSSPAPSWIGSAISRFSDSTGTPRAVSMLADNGAWLYQYQDSVDLETAAPSSAFLPRSPGQSSTENQHWQDTDTLSQESHTTTTTITPASAPVPRPLSDADARNRPLPRLPPPEAQSDGSLPQADHRDRETNGAGQPVQGAAAAGKFLTLTATLPEIARQREHTPLPQYDQLSAQEQIVGTPPPQYEAHGRTEERDFKRA